MWRNKLRLALTSGENVPRYCPSQCLTRSSRNFSAKRRKLYPLGTTLREYICWSLTQQCISVVLLHGMHMHVEWCAGVVWFIKSIFEELRTTHRVKTIYRILFAAGWDWSGKYQRPAWEKLLCQNLTGQFMDGDDVGGTGWYFVSENGNYNLAS